MSMTIAQLPSQSDDQIISLHDAASVDTSVGVNYYLDELRRRDLERAAAANAELARRAYWLTVASTALAVVSIVVAVITLVVTG